MRQWWRRFASRPQPRPHATHVGASASRSQRGGAAAAAAAAAARSLAKRPSERGASPARGCFYARPRPVFMAIQYVGSLPTWQSAAVPPNAQLLRETPHSGAIVCAPCWPGSAWYAELMEISDEWATFPTGSLQRVAFDAPPHLEQCAAVAERCILRAAIDYAPVDNGMLAVSW